ncbi:MAG: protein kinase domain-containing protein [Phycisphaerales bacterium]
MTESMNNGEAGTTAGRATDTLASATPFPDPALDELFGFASPADQWVERARRAETPTPPLGRLGGYELRDQIGRGGQGVVYRAIQPGTGRTVALKVLNMAPVLDGAENSAFSREVGALTRLDHPNVVRVFAAEVIEGHPTLVMEWVEGDTIDRWADRVMAAPVRDTNAVLAAFAAACDGVSHAHQRGVIHRDLKPSNIVVSRTGVARVLDFGVARLLDRGEPIGPAISVTAGFMGTPQYAAPEQLEATPDGIDTRADVFALGAVLYRLLTGLDRIACDAPLRDLIEAGRSGAVRRPSSVRPHLGKELDWIVLRALAPERERRYQTVDALATDVRRFLEGRPVEAHPPTTGYLIGKSFRRHRLAWLGTIGFVVVLASSALVMARLYASAEHARREAEAALGRESLQQLETKKQEEIAKREAATQADLSRFMTDLLMNADRSSQGGKADITIKEAVLRAAKRLDDGSQRYDPLVEATVRKTVGDLFMAFGDAASAIPHMERSLALRKDVAGVESEPAVEMLMALGRAYRATGRLELAEQTQLEAIRVRRGLYGERSPLIAESLTGLGITYRFMNRLDDSARTTSEAIAMYAATLGPEDENVFMMTANLAMLYATAARGPEAVATAEAVKPLFEQRFPAESKEIVGFLMPYFHALRCVGRMEDALRVMQRILRIEVQLQGEEHVAVRDRRRDLAETLLLLGRDEGAEAAAIQVYAATLRIDGPDHRNTAAAGALLARASATQGGNRSLEPESAIARRAAGALLAAGEHALGHTARAHLARILVEQGEFDRADRELADSIAALREQCPPPIAIMSAINLAIQCYDRMASLEPRGPWGDKAAALRRQRTQYCGGWTGKTREPF